MGLKLYLNKFLKVDNVEQYTFSELITLKKEYEKLVEEAEGVDPDFPMYVFGGEKGKKIGGTNIHTITKDVDEEEETYSTVDARNTTVEERALKFLRNLDKKT